MLCISRKVTESVIITAPDGTKMVVKILSRRGDKIRLGITAPRDYAVHREEVQAKIDEETSRDKRQRRESGTAESEG